MTRNFFIGEGFLPQFAHIIYDQLLNRKWVSNSFVMQQPFMKAVLRTNINSSAIMFATFDLT